MSSAGTTLFVLLFLLLAPGHPLATPEGASIMSDGPPKVLEKYPRVIFASVGGSVKLDCPLERSNKVLDSSEFTETIIVWKKNEKVIGLGWERFRVKEDLLSIKDVEETDSGNYTCTATNGFGSVVGYYLLCVTANDGSSSDNNGRKSPQNSEFCAPGDNSNGQTGGKDPEDDGPKLVENVLLDTSATAGDSVTLNCQVRCSIPPRIQWFRKLGQESSKWQRRPDLFLKQSPHSLQTSSNSSSYFLKADSFQQLIGPDIVTQLIQTGAGSYLSSVTLKRASLKDSGIYVCAASNSRGIDYKYASLKVISEADSGGSLLASSDNKISWVAAFVVCVLSLVLVVVVILVVRKCKSQKGQKGRSPPAAATLPPKTHQPQSFQTSVNLRGDHRTVDFYPPSNFEYAQVDQAEPFVGRLPHPMYKFADANPQIFHAQQPQFMPSTTSSDKTVSSYQSIHPDERCNPQIHQHHFNRSQSHPLQWSPNQQPVYY